MCPELQYTKDRNENINQVKTQLATMNQNCVLNEGCVHHLHMKQVEVGGGGGGGMEKLFITISEDMKLSG